MVYCRYNSAELYIFAPDGNEDGWAMPLTDTQMKDQMSFAGWDFNEYDSWRMRTDVDALPHLRWEFPIGDFNYDMFVNLSDYAIFATSWHSQEGDINWNFNCNLNEYDESWNVIDLTDLMDFCGSWLESR